MGNYSIETAIKKSINIPPVAYPYHGEEFLIIKNDIPYCINNSTAQTFDIYYPKDFEAFHHKTVLFVNGGGAIKRNYKSYPCFTSWGEWWQ